MPLPLSKQELADWILRRLGAPVVNVEIADIQLEDVIDEAVQFFQEYHYDGAERTYRTIKIEGDVINGNNRKHQDVNAPMYDPASREYRIGDRVMTYKTNGMPDKIWVKYDSDEIVTFKFIVLDSDGSLFVYDSDLPKRDGKFIFDSAAQDHIDSDGLYVTYDSDTHNTTIFFPFTTGRYRYQEVNTKPDSENFVRDSDGTFVQYDSDIHKVYQYDSDDNGLWYDSEGTFVQYDSDKHVTKGYEVVVDSDLVDVFYVDSDGTFVQYDSDKHGVVTTYVSDPAGLYVREEGLNRFVLASIDPKYATSPKFSPLYNRPTLYSQVDIQPQRYSRQFTFPTVYVKLEENAWVDSEGTYVLYDSDKHFNYGFDSEGSFVQDSDGNTVPYDSDIHAINYIRDNNNGEFVYNFSDSDSDLYRVENALVSFEIDSENLTGKWVDSDGTYVPYDSDKYSYDRYDSDPSGLFVDSEGVFVVYQSTKYQTYNFDSESIKLDSDGNSIGAIPDSDGMLDGLYVRTYLDKDSEVYTLYDSDTHNSLFYDSDGTGNKLNLVRNIDMLFRRSINLVPVQRFRRVDASDVQRYHKVFTPFARYEKVHNVQKYYRRHQLLGQRFSFTLQKEVRRTDYGFEEFWKEEDKVLTEQVIDYDYSKVGQVGIPIPDTIIGINKVFRIDNFSGMGMWNYEYQYFLNNFDFFYGNGGASSMPLTNYYITKSNLELIDHMMNVQPAIRFNKHRNRLYLDTNWTRLGNMAKSKDYYLMIECYEVNDPEVFGDVYKDKWLKRYATALAKMQWGTNLKKYQNTELPGGLVLSGQELYDEGREEAKELEEELKNSRLEMDFLMG